jgi:hypothetical protein
VECTNALNKPLCRYQFGEPSLKALEEKDMEMPCNDYIRKNFINILTMESRMNSLQGGFFRGVVHNTNLLPPSDNLKLVLIYMGASIFGLTEEPLRRAIQNHGNNVINVSQGGDFFFVNFPTIEIPLSNNVKDIMILHIHGNSILKKSKFYPSNNI